MHEKVLVTALGVTLAPAVPALRAATAPIEAPAMARRRMLVMLFMSLLPKGWEQNTASRGARDRQ
jgi:hypothetical protein